MVQVLFMTIYQSLFKCTNEHINVGDMMEYSNKAKTIQKQKLFNVCRRDVPPTTAALSNMDYRVPKLVVRVVATDHVPNQNSQFL